LKEREKPLRPCHRGIHKGKTKANEIGSQRHAKEPKKSAGKGDVPVASYRENPAARLKGANGEANN